MATGPLAPAFLLSLADVLPCGSRMGSLPSRRVTFVSCLTSLLLHLFPPSRERCCSDRRSNHRACLLYVDFLAAPSRSPLYISATSGLPILYIPIPYAHLLPASQLASVYRYLLSLALQTIPLYMHYPSSRIGSLFALRCSTPVLQHIKKGIGIFYESRVPRRPRLSDNVHGSYGGDAPGTMSRTWMR